MSAHRQELIYSENQPINIWENEEAVRQIQTIFAPTLSVVEFKIFHEIGKATGLNPYLREIWAVKYDKQSVQIFIGRDGYRKGAQRQPSYDYHLADAVYSNDDFNVSNGNVSHNYSLKDRGNLLGAYCVVKRKGSSQANYVFVELKEYDKKQSTWVTLKTTMIKKVAEAQALRSTFQEVFANTYHEFERFDIPQQSNIPKIGKGMAGVEESLGIIEEAPAVEVIYEVEDTQPKVSLEENALTEELLGLICEKNIPPASIAKWNKRFGVNVLQDIPAEGKEKIINHLKNKEKK